MTRKYCVPVGTFVVSRVQFPSTSVMKRLPGKSVQLPSTVGVVVDCTRSRKPETMFVKTAVNCHGLLKRIGETPADSLTESMGDSDGGTPFRTVAPLVSVMKTLPAMSTVIPDGAKNRASLPTPSLELLVGDCESSPATVLTTPAGE